MMNKITELTIWLHASRGKWPTFANESGVNYWFIQRLGQGRATNPSFKTIDKLYKFMQKKRKIADTLIEENQEDE